MTGKGTISRAPRRSLRILLTAQIVWLAAVCLLGAWWGSLVLRQASKIAELEQAAGVAVNAAHAQWLKTQHMLIWESASFLVLLLASTGVLYFLYWRDARRTRSLQAFFASMTHELRTPLTSIRLQAESISDAMGEQADQKRELVERLLEDTQRLEQQVDRVLELARVEGGGPLFTQRMHLQSWIERVIREWRAHQGGRVEVVLGLGDVQIEADQVAIEVILKNLLENAVRHSQRDDLRIEIKTEPTAEGVSLHFRDNGRGFEGNPKQLGKLFEKGSRSQGAGVGLYLIQVLMKRMGGQAHFGAPLGGQPGFEVILEFQGGSTRA